MKLKIFDEKMTQLEAAFRIPPLSEKSYDLYLERLKDIPDKDFVSEVDLIIETEHKFPSIARLLQRNGQPAMRPTPKASCASCHRTDYTCLIGGVCKKCYEKELYGDTGSASTPPVD